jgi:DNA-binding GntR family transcriptional regulator
VLTFQEPFSYSDTRRPYNCQHFGDAVTTRPNPDKPPSLPAQAGEIADVTISQPMQNASETRASAAMGRIIGLIRSGELRPGAVVNEADLAKRFDMSRGPVREAIRNLEGRKLIVRENFRRARVALLGRNQVRELFELRECLEGMAARLAARHMSVDTLQRLSEQVSASKESLEYSLYFTHDYRFNFHTEIINHCGNQRIKDTLLFEVYDLVRLYRWTSGAVPGRHGQAHKENWQICRALVARDEDLAESLMRMHIQRSMQLEEA